MLWSRPACRPSAHAKRSAFSGQVHEAVEPVGVGAQPSFARRLSDDHRRGCRRPLLFPPWPRRGPELHHQDDDGQSRLARRDHRRDAQSNHRKAGAHAGGDAPSRLPAQLHHPGATTIFVNLKGSTSAQQVADTWYHVRKSIADMRHTLPSGVRGPFFNDEFGDTFGIIYGFTADVFTPRELRDYVEDIRSQLLSTPDVSKIEILGAQDEQIFIEFSMQELASLGIDRGSLIAALRAQNIVRPAGIIQTGNESVSMRVSGAFSSEQDIANVNFAINGRMLRLSDIARIHRGYVDPPQPQFGVN